MLSGEHVGLREVRRTDVEAEHAALEGDAELHSVASNSPWRPRALEARIAEFDKRNGEPGSESSAEFTVQRLDDPDGAWIGGIGLWQIDQHQRTAHVGITLISAVRGQGFGRDALATICRYGFEVRSLERLQLETLATNTAMQATARACGFMEEGRLRSHAWVMGSRVDELLFGLLADEWRATRRPSE